MIALAYYQGMSMREIAAELDIAVGTVKSRLHYAITNLRVALEQVGLTTAGA